MQGIFTVLNGIGGRGPMAVLDAVVSLNSQQPARCKVSAVLMKLSGRTTDEAATKKKHDSGSGVGRFVIGRLKNKEPEIHTAHFFVCF
jgi:hypothetical protein